MTTAPTQPAPSKVDWRDQIFEVFQDHDIKQVYHVPDAGHGRLIEACQKSNSIRTLALTTEEEGIALLAGAWLGGQRGALLMQSSGVGNCINMLSLARTCRFPLLMVVTMRGQWGERNPWQVPMGSTTRAVLEAAGLLVFEATEAESVAATVDAAAAMVFSGPAAAAVLINQRVLGAKAFTPATPAGTEAEEATR